MASMPADGLDSVTGVACDSRVTKSTKKSHVQNFILLISRSFLNGFPRYHDQTDRIFVLYFFQIFVIT
jgi:hypothetical protein